MMPPLLSDGSNRPRVVSKRIRRRYQTTGTDPELFHKDAVVAQTQSRPCTELTPTSCWRVALAARDRPALATISRRQRDAIALSVVCARPVLLR